MRNRKRYLRTGTLPITVSHTENFEDNLDLEDGDKTTLRNIKSHSPQNTVSSRNILQSFLTRC